MTTPRTYKDDEIKDMQPTPTSQSADPIIKGLLSKITANVNGDAKHSRDLFARLVEQIGQSSTSQVAQRLNMSLSLAPVAEEVVVAAPASAASAVASTAPQATAANVNTPSAGR